MKRVICSALVACAVMGLPLQAAARKKPWSVEAPYAAPGAGACTSGGSPCLYAYSCADGVGCTVLRLPKPAARVHVQVIDQTGQPVLAQVFIGGHQEMVGLVCGVTDEPLFVNGATELRIDVIAGTCTDTTPSVPTTGTVRVTKA